MAATSRKKAKKRVTKKAAAKAPARKKAVKKAAAPRKAVKKTSATKKAAKKTVASRKTAKKVVAKKTLKKAAAKKSARTVAAKKTAKKTTAKKTAPKKAVARKAVAKKTATKPPAKTTVKKTIARKKTAARRASEIQANKGSGSDDLIHGITPYRAGKREAYMNRKQLYHFNNILAAWRMELVDEVNRTLHTMQDETVNHPDPNDRATQESDMSLELRSRDRERKLIRKIDGTIALLESGDYGYCEKCGVEIGIARLEARPTASLCVDCKTLDEIREKQMV